MKHQPLRSVLLLVFGELSWSRILLILVPGLVSGLVVWEIHGIRTLADGLLVLASIDIVSGCIANASRQTNQRWRQQPRWQRWLFVFIHLSVYPYMLWQLTEQTLIPAVLTWLLLVKTQFFVRGTLWRRPDTYEQSPSHDA